MEDRDPEGGVRPRGGCHAPENDRHPEMETDHRGPREREPKEEKAEKVNTPKPKRKTQILDFTKL